jgi:hypothetical protein
MIGQTGKFVEGGIPVLIEAILRHFPGGTVECHKNPIRIADVIPADQLPTLNKSIKFYSYTNLLGGIRWVSGMWVNGTGSGSC